MKKEDLLRIGVISSTHGIHGEVKVFPTTDYPEQFEELESVFLDNYNTLLPMEIENVRYFKDKIILKFKNYDNINEIECYKGKDLLITRQQAVPETLTVLSVGLQAINKLFYYLNSRTKRREGKLCG